MVEVLYFSVIVMLGLAVVGFFVRLMIMGLFCLYDRLPRKAALSLKILTLSPALVLGLLGLVAACEFFLLLVFLCGVSSLFVFFGRLLIYRGQNKAILNKLVGGGMLVAAVLPFVLIGFNALTTYLEPGEFSFSIQNYSPHEIVLKEVQVDDQMIFTGEHRFNRLPATCCSSPIEHASSLSLRAGFSRWPRKIKLLTYDARLQKEIRGEVRLPFSSEHPSYPFHIVYEPEGFRYDKRLYP